MVWRGINGSSLGRWCARAARVSIGRQSRITGRHRLSRRRNPCAQPGKRVGWLQVLLAIATRRIQNTAHRRFFFLNLNTARVLWVLSRRLRDVRLWRGVFANRCQQKRARGSSSNGRDIGYGLSDGFGNAVLSLDIGNIQKRFGFRLVDGLNLNLSFNVCCGLNLSLKVCCRLYLGFNLWSMLLDQLSERLGIRAIICHLDRGLIRSLQHQWCHVRLGFIRHFGLSKGEGRWL